MRSLLWVSLLAASVAAAEEPKPIKLPLELPLIDFPDSLTPSYQLPTWDQAFHVSLAETEVLHWGVHSLTSSWPSAVGVPVELVVTGGLDVLTYSYVGGTLWAGAEGRRGVLAHQGIASTNGLYGYWNPLQPPATVVVAGIPDLSLFELKRDHPADLVHAEEAGLETQYNLITRVDSDTFYYDRPAYQNIPYQLYARFRLAWDWVQCSQLTPAKAAALYDQPDPLQRDFAGAECTAYVYDLSRPEEPFTSRGADVNGGTRRVRDVTDLTGTEFGMLIRNRNLVLVSLLDPQLLGIAHFTVKDPVTGDPIWWNFGALSQIAPFGTVFDLHGYLKAGDFQLHVAGHVYRNQTLTLPGLSADLVRLPIDVAGQTFRASLTAAAWLQPAQQRYDDTAFAFGALGGVSLFWSATDFLEVYARAQLKTAGWVPLTTSLDAAAEASLGITFTL